MKILSVLALMIAGSACAAAPSALKSIPTTGSPQNFQVSEYALVEQSSDSPSHPGFQARVPEAVAGQRAGWPFAQAEQTVDDPNQALAAFGYHLAANPSPPFSGYALYSRDTLVQRDIARFWPVTVKSGEPGGQPDFRLAFQTLEGERLLASQDGIRPWPGSTRTGAGWQDDAEVQDIRGAVALADIRAGVAGEAGQVFTGGVSAPAPGELSPNGEIFYRQLIAGAELSFYVKDGIFHLNYAGRDLPYTYDLILHDNPGDLSIYNPGRAGDLVWFYALRDGLWYYVEVGEPAN